METIWVLENVKRDYSFYSRLQVLMLVASVCLWRKYHPDHYTVFYGDEMSLRVLDGINLWHEKRLLTYPEKIDREIFWSSPKTKIISKTKIPLIVVDHDFLVFKSISDLFDGELMYTYNEDAYGWYPDKHDALNKKLSSPVKFLNNLAANVSLFYLPAPVCANEYGKQTLKNHEEFTAMGSPYMNTNYMILSEQYMLKQWLDGRGIAHKSLSKNLWDCKNLGFIDQQVSNGILNKEESLLTYKHYGVWERRLKEGLVSDYWKECEFLKRCIKSGKLIEDGKLSECLSKIKNV